MTKQQNRTPAYAFPPGVFLLEEMEARNISRQHLADVLQCPLSVVADIISGKHAITPAIAIHLGNAFGTSAEYWIGLESKYHLFRINTNSADSSNLSHAGYSSRNPYFIEGPAQICFSGGRTSGYMLRQILDAHDGKLPRDVHVVFTNTGKEREETLEFIRDCGEHWNVPITWLEWQGFLPPGQQCSWIKPVTFETASRKGEPFDRLIDTLGVLPNPTQRLCTAYLKVHTGKSYMRLRGYSDWVNVMGIRADEPLRIAKMRNPNRDNRGGEPELPLAMAKVTKHIVGDFWRKQPFDLRLQNIDGTTPEGNCDLCFLKHSKNVLSQIRANPPKAVWWMRQEAKPLGDGTTATFRNDRPSYLQMHRMALNHGELFSFGADDDALVDCMCGD